jgi:hypothetical protein
MIEQMEKEKIEVYTRNDSSPDPYDPTRSQGIDKLAEALAKAQGEFSIARKNKDNPFFKSRYADLAEVIEACRDALCTHDLSVTQTTDFHEGKVMLTTRLMHKSGQWIKSFLPLPPFMKPQELGASMTYLRRYSLTSLLGISIDEDDDGNSAPDYEDKAGSKKEGFITPDQVGELEGLIGDKSELLPDFLKWAGVKSLKQIKQSQFQRCHSALTKKIKSQA